MNYLSNKKQVLDYKVKNSSTIQFFKQDGIKGKAKFVGNKSLEALSKLKTVKTLKNIITFIALHIKTILIVIATILAVILIIHLSFFFSSLVNSIGQSPHYYCQLNSKEQDGYLYKQYCMSSAIGGADSIAQAAVSLSMRDSFSNPERAVYHANGWDDVRRYLGKPGYNPETFLTVGPQIIQTANKLYQSGDRTRPGWPEIGGLYACCDLNTAMAVLWSGADDNFPMYLQGGQMFEPHMKSSITGYLYNKGSEAWVEVPKGSKVLPGDIALGIDEESGVIGHVWMYVATWENGSWIDNSIVQEKYPGSTSNRYEGSQEMYYPQVSYDDDPWEGDTEKIFRFIGEANPNSPFKAINSSQS